MKLGFLGFGKIATHHARAFSHLGVDIKYDYIQSRRIQGDAFHKDVDAIVVGLLPECLPDFMEKIQNDPRPFLIEKMPPFPNCFPPFKSAWYNKIAAYNRRHYTTTKIFRERIERGGLVHFDGDLPPSGAQMHGFDLMLHLFGDIRATTVKAPLNTSIRAIFSDESVWTLKPFESLTVVKGGSVEGTEADPIRKYHFPEVNRWQEDATFKPGFLEQARAFLKGIETGDYGISCTVEENRKRYQILDSLRGTKPSQVSEFTVRKV